MAVSCSIQWATMDGTMAATAPRFRRDASGCGKAATPFGLQPSTSSALLTAPSKGIAGGYPPASKVAQELLDDFERPAGLHGLRVRVGRAMKFDDVLRTN